MKFPKISNLMVLESAAGFYIGKVMYYSDDEFNPYSRESNYFINKEDAETALENNTYIEVY